MKKFLVFLSLLILAITAIGCENTRIPGNNEAELYEPLPFYTAATPDADALRASSSLYELSRVTPEMLIGTWILESQETPEPLMERAVILESGIALFYSHDGTEGPVFWSLYNDVLTSHLGERYVTHPIRINADGALVFTYNDGFTGTYALSDRALPQQVIMPELVGTWHLADQTGDDILPDMIEFLKDGSGNAYYYTAKHMRNFEWGVIEYAVLLKDFEDTHGIESAFIIEVFFVYEIDAYTLAIIYYNGSVAWYIFEVQSHVQLPR